MLRYLLLTALLMAWADGSCFLGASKTNSKTGETFCKVFGRKLQVGEEKTFLDKCFSCSCGTSHFSCCGIGINAGIIEPPEGQILVEDANCTFHFEPK